MQELSPKFVVDSFFMTRISNLILTEDDACNYVPTGMIKKGQLKSIGMRFGTFYSMSKIKLDIISTFFPL